LWAEQRKHAAATATGSHGGGGGPAGAARRPRVNIFTLLSFLPLFYASLVQVVRDVAHVGNRGRDLHRDGRRHGRAGDTGALQMIEGGGNDVSIRKPGLCGAAPERAPGARGDRDGDRRRQQRERVLRGLQAGSPHRTAVGVASAEAARPSRPDRDRARAAPRQRLQAQ